jgi:hypothetical protein
MLGALRTKWDARCGRKNFPLSSSEVLRKSWPLSGIWENLLDFGLEFRFACGLGSAIAAHFLKNLCLLRPLGGVVGNSDEEGSLPVCVVQPQRRKTDDKG